MLNSLTIRDITDNALLYLADYMRLYGVNLRRINAMQIANQPEFTYGLAMAYLHACRGNQDQRIAKLRLAKKRGIKNLRSRDILEIADIQYIRFERWIDELIVKAELIQLNDGSTRSLVLRTFGFSAVDRDQGDMWTEVTCPDCASTEVAPSYAPVEHSKLFEPLVGPYARCNSCSHVVRPLLTESPTEYPAESDPEVLREEWELFSDFMEDVVDQANKELQKTAMGQPDMYLVHYGRRTGIGQIPTSGRHLAEALRPSGTGDFAIQDGRLRMNEDGVIRLECKVFHHDAPLGETVCIQPGWHCELDESFVVSQDADEESLADRCRVAEMLLCGWRREFEFNEDTHQFKVVSSEGLAQSLGYLAKGLGIVLESEEDSASPKTPIRALSSAIRWLLIESIWDARSGKVNKQRSAHLRGLIDCYLENT